MIKVLGRHEDEEADICMKHDENNGFVAYFQIDKNPKRKLETPEDYDAFAISTYKSAVDYSRIVEISFQPLFPNCIPAICSIASFASELFMKSIVYLKLQKQCKGHDLFEIYNLLPNEIKEEIKHNHPCSNTKKEIFELELKETGKGFETLRYHHEKSRLAFNAVFIIELMLTLRSCCSHFFNKER